MSQQQRIGSVSPWLAGPLWALGLALVVPSCEPLPELGTPGTCGNKVKDPHEACDTYVGDEHANKANLTCESCWYVCESTDQCPSGEVCGDDHKCRAPAGSFAKDAEGEGADELAVSDLDGDGLVDLIATTDREVAVRFGHLPEDPPVVLRQVFEPLFLPVAIDREGDGEGADLLVPRFGFVSLRTTGAGSERKLEPAGLPALRMPAGLDDVQVVPLEYPASNDTPDLLFHASIEIPTLGSLDALLFFTDYSVATLGPTLTGPNGLAGPAVVAHIDQRLESPCEDIVLAYAGMDQVEFFNPCVQVGTDDWETAHCDFPFLDCPEDLPRRVDVGAKVVRGPFVAHLATSTHPPDEYLDLLVQVEQPDRPDCSPCYEVRAAFGAGDGTFHSDGDNIPLPPAEANNAFAVLPEFLDETALLLTVGDLDGRGQVDVVTPRFVRLDGEGRTVAANSAEPWTDAVIADFNGDGLADVLAVDGVNSRAAFHNNVGEGVLAPFLIPTAAPLSQLRVGDFDGDRLNDATGLAHFPPDEQTQPPTDERYEVSVLFGRAAGPPEAPVSIGSSGLPVRLTTGKLVSDLLFTLGDVIDGASDIVAVGIDAKNHESQLSIFVGRGDREIRSALGLVEIVGDSLFSLDANPFLPLRAVPGSFRDRSEGPDPGATREAWQLAALSIEALKAENDYRVWLLPRLGEITSFKSMQVVDEPIQRQDLLPERDVAIWELGMYEAADLDRDGLDELVVLAPSAVENAPSVYRVGQSDGSDGWRWLPQDGPGEFDLPILRGAGPTIPCRDPYFFPDHYQPSETRCVDFDFESVANTALEMPVANGRLRACRVVSGADESAVSTEPRGDDLVLLSRPAVVGESRAEPWLGEATIRVRLNDGTLPLETDQFEPVMFPPEVVDPEVVDPETTVKPRDFVCLNSDRDEQQEIIVLTGEGLWRVNVRRGNSEPVFDVAHVMSIAGYERVAAGDMDGDGLEDLVIANPHGSLLLTAQCQEPCPEWER